MPVAEELYPLCPEETRQTLSALERGEHNWNTGVLCPWGGQKNIGIKAGEKCLCELTRHDTEQESRSGGNLSISYRCSGRGTQPGC